MCFCQIIWSVEKEESLSWHEREALLKVRKGSLYNKETPSLNGEKLNL